MEQCGHCGMWHQVGVCPRISAIEYNPNGTVKRVEYHRPAPLQHPQMPLPITCDGFTFNS